MAFETLAPGENQNGNALVLDNSVMMRWLFDDGSPADRRYAASVFQYIQASQCSVLVPYVWVYEAAFVVNYYVQQGDIEQEEGSSHLESLHDLSSVIADWHSPAVLFEFSHQHGLSAYDAAYLILARSQGIPIATLDKKMRRVAAKVDVKAF